jgi:cephalosporin hydroxylase
LYQQSSQSSNYNLSTTESCQRYQRSCEAEILSNKREISQLKNSREIFQLRKQIEALEAKLLNQKQTQILRESKNKMQLISGSKETWASSLIGPLPKEASLTIPSLHSIPNLQKYFHRQYPAVDLIRSTEPPESIYGNLTVLISGQEVKVDDILHGYQIIFESAALFTYTNFFGVSLQQDPSDAFALMDLLWRLQPDLLIELGTAGGGSAFFYAMIMTAYNPSAHVITMDPKRLEDWNLAKVRQICSHCVSGRDTALWNSDTIHFLPLLPTDSNTTALVDEYIERWKPKTVLVMDDSNHLTQIVRGNIETYARYVTPGSYLIVQDMKMERLYGNTKTSPPRAVREFLRSPMGQDFEVDRTFEYYLYTQHARGFLKRKTATG